MIAKPKVVLFVVWWCLVLAAALMVWVVNGAKDAFQ